MTVTFSDDGEFESFLAHYGIPRKSGRYPWGSGGDEDEGTRSRGLISYLDEMRKSGLSDTEIAQGLGISTTVLRNLNTIAKNKVKAENIATAEKLKDKGYSNVAIGAKMGINESSVRALLSGGARDKVQILQTTTEMLRRQVDEKDFVDVGTGVEYHVNVPRKTLDTALTALQDEGYTVEKVQVDQLGTNNKTTIKVLAPPGTEYRDIASNKDKIRQINEHTEDDGRTMLGIQPPLAVDPKRVAVKYAEEGGSDADGVIYVRPGKDDLSLGNAQYAQVRIAVGEGNGTHYLKGMAIYKDDLPNGVDLLFNTNKSSTGNKLDAMKEIKSDPDNPFGAVVRQLPKLDAKGNPIPNTVRSSMNIVNDQGDWDKWNNNLPSQFLSKQAPSLAKERLDAKYDQQRRELDEILSLTNPAVRKKLLDSYADSADSASVHLKAAALPRQKTRVILPVGSMKETEVYAPGFRDGESVVLVRFPHGGTFEIPELKVNNRNLEAKKLLGDAQDAIGIHSKVASRLSGADFDGDTVLVIPNNSGKVKTKSPLAELNNFDPQRRFPGYDGMRTIDGGVYNAKTKKTEFPPGKKSNPSGKGMQMGLVSNLITDMTIKGASDAELASAVKHSMVVIDAEKHSLNYQQSAIDNGIPTLMKKYQDRAGGGASTLISRAKSPLDVAERKSTFTVNKETGKKEYKLTGASFVDANGKTVFRTTKSTKLGEATDAHTLSSGTKIEDVYAVHSNRMKALADEARKESVNTKTIPYSPSAKRVYSEQVADLNAKLHVALFNSPRERQAQIIANATYRAKLAASPNMEASDKKKIKGLALTAARNRVGAKKDPIVITDKEWEAIQAGAITNNKLTQILKHADVDRVKQLATPKATPVLSSSKLARAQLLKNSGHTRAEIADALGVSVSTLDRALEGGS